MPAPVEFCVDSTYAIAVADGKWIVRRKHKELARRLNHAMARLRMARGHKNVTIRHVRAHARNAGNETADRLAKQGATGRVPQGYQALRQARKIYREVSEEASGTHPTKAGARQQAGAQPMHVSDLGQELGDG